MRFYVRRRRSTNIIIVSLIDILTILLIFFVVATTFRKDQPQVVINLPESKTAEASSEASKDPLVVGISDDQKITIDARTVTADQLKDAIIEARQRSPQRPLALKASKQAEFQTIIDVLDALKQAGVKNLPAFMRGKE